MVVPCPSSYVKSERFSGGQIPLRVTASERVPWFDPCDFYPGNREDVTLHWLVVWLPFFIFLYIGLLIIPIDFHIFQRGSNHQPVHM